MSRQFSYFRAGQVHLFMIFSLLLASVDAFGQDLQQIIDQKAIQGILADIPYVGSEIIGTDMPYKNIAERLPKLGLSVQRMSVEKLQKEDCDNSQGAYKKGDVSYTFNTNEPNINVKAICPITDSFSFIKRGKKWLPDDRNAAFIMTYICSAPDRSK